MIIKLIIFFNTFFFLNCSLPNFFQYSDEWVLLKNIKNDCLYESSISGNGDLLIFYKIKQIYPQELILDYGLQKIENNQFLVEIYWRSNIDFDLINKFKKIIGDYPIINANFEINESAWIRTNNNAKISNYISQTDVYSNKIKSGLLKKSKSLIFLPVWNIEMYNKITKFFNKEINNTGSYKENKCLN